MEWRFPNARIKFVCFYSNRPHRAIGIEEDEAAKPEWENRREKKFLSKNVEHIMSTQNSTDHLFHFRFCVGVELCTFVYFGQLEFRMNWTCPMLHRFYLFHCCVCLYASLCGYTPASALLVTFVASFHCLRWIRRSFVPFFDFEWN